MKVAKSFGLLLLAAVLALIVFLSRTLFGWPDWPDWPDWILADKSSAELLEVLLTLVAGGIVLVAIAKSFGPKVLRWAIVLLVALVPLSSASYGAAAAQQEPDESTEEESDDAAGDVSSGLEVTVTQGEQSVTVTGSTLLDPPVAAEDDDESETAPSAETGLLENIDKGVENRIHQVLPQSVGQVDLGAAGWAIVAAGLVLLWRSLETVNARRSATPVLVEKFIVPGDYKDAARLSSRFENSLAQAGILEPASIPGGEVTADLVDIFAAEKSPAGWFAPVLRLVRLAFPKRGTVVIPTLESENPPRVSVRVVTARQRRTLFARSFSQGTVDTSIDRAAAYVGQQTHNYGNTTPKWARWDSLDAEGFDLFVELHGNRELPASLDYFPQLDQEITSSENSDTATASPETPNTASGPPKKSSGKRPLHALQMAVRDCPSTGIARVELGHSYELFGLGDTAPESKAEIQRARWRALRLYLGAAFDHRRMLVATYRAATTLSLIVGDLQSLDNRLLQNPDQDRSKERANLAPRAEDSQAIRQLYENFWSEAGQIEKRSRQNWKGANCVKGFGDSIENFATAPVHKLTKVLTTVATRLLDRALRQLWVPSMAYKALRFPDERQYWLDFLRDHERRRHLKGQIKAVKLILELRKANLEQINVVDTAFQRALAAAGNLRATVISQSRLSRQRTILYKKWAALRRGTADPSTALKEVVGEIEQLTETQTSSEQQTKTLHDSHQARTEFDLLKVSSEDLDKCCEEMNKLVKKFPGAGTYYNAGCFYAIAVSYAPPDKHIPDLLATATGYLHRARRAPGAGFPSFDWLDKDPDLDSLRKDPVFNELLHLSKAAKRGLDSLDKLEKEAKKNIGYL